MHRTHAFALVAVAVAFAVGCGTGALDPNDYDRSCRAPSDCVPVSFTPTCNSGCGPGPDGAVNRSALSQLDDDTQRATALCLPQLVECVFGGASAVVTTCDSGVCGIAPAPLPPRDVSWNWANPIAATTIPTNTIFAGVVSPGTDPTQALTITALVEGEDAPRAVTITNDPARCLAPGVCPSVLDVGAPLPPDATVAFHFTPATDDDVTWTTDDGDDTAPTVAPLQLSSADVSKANGVLVKAIDLRATLPVDDSGLARIDVLRSIDGGDEQALDPLRPTSSR